MREHTAAPRWASERAARQAGRERGMKAPTRVNPCQSAKIWGGSASRTGIGLESLVVKTNDPGRVRNTPLRPYRALQAVFEASLQLYPGYTR